MATTMATLAGTSEVLSRLSSGQTSQLNFGLKGVPVISIAPKRQLRNLTCSAVARKEENAPMQEVKRVSQRVAAAALAAAVLLAGAPALADLNKYEADKRGEFGIGSAAQYGSADLRKSQHPNENFRRANFTSADMREADFSGCTFNGGYLEKAVAAKTNFEGADFSDALMDRMVLNEANLRDAVLARVVLTRSDLGKADIEGADFSDAVLDLPQKTALCKYAKGTNSTTGMDTRTSLGCSNSRRNAYGTPSAPALSTPSSAKLLDRDGFCNDASGLCKATGLE
eukprot:jgi/Mesen1/6623/ME000034S06071